MKKEFAVKVLMRIKQIHDTRDKLRELGIDLMEHETQIGLLTESIALLFINDEIELERAIDDIQWWLYEKVDKIITVDGVELDVNKPDDFINWFEEWYKPKTKITI